MHLPSGEPEPTAVRRARGRVASDFAAAQDRANPRHQFPHADGPIEIVVGAEFQRSEFVPKGQPRLETTQPTLASIGGFMNFYPFAAIETISPRPMLFIAGDKAHSIEFSEDAYKRAGEPKELVIVPGAGHVDLYDCVNLIPFGKLSDFFRGNLS
jgi:fermentation-respiration switch protein FrsA (DUF1100 family)